MPILRKEVEARIEQLKKQAEVYRQQFNITMGAVAEAEYWLSKIEEDNDV